MLWCLENNRKGGPTNIPEASTWCEQSQDRSSLVPLVRRWKSFASQHGRLTETKVVLQVPPNRMLSHEIVGRLCYPGS